MRLETKAMDIKNKSILIIDDDPDVIILARKFLEQWGPLVVEANSVPDGLDMLKSGHFDLIMTDLQMQPFSGFAFLEKYHSMKKLKKTPVIVLSALNDRQSVYTAASLGACDYLLKPFDQALLLKKVRKAMGAVEFLQFSFPSNELPEVEARVEVRITAVGETGMKVEGPVQPKENTQVHLKGPLIQELLLHKTHFKTSPLPPPAGNGGSFISDILFAGLDQTVVEKIRNHFAVKGRK